MALSITLFLTKMFGKKAATMIIIAGKDIAITAGIAVISKITSMLSSKLSRFKNHYNVSNNSEAEKYHATTRTNNKNIRSGNGHTRNRTPSRKGKIKDIKI